jgi:hypothetical protein
VLSLITPENLPDILIGVGAIITAFGGWTLWRVQKEPPKPGTPDAAALALAENTRATLAMVEAMKAQNSHFADNNEMFKALGPMLSDMKHDMAETKANTAAMRDALNRRH